MEEFDTTLSDDLGYNPRKEAQPGLNAFISSLVLLIVLIPGTLYMTGDTQGLGKHAEVREDSELRG